MPLVNAGAGNGQRAFYTVAQISQLVAMGITNIRFGFLPTAGAVNEQLGTHAVSGIRPIGALPRVTHSVGLITCASVIYVLGLNYYVHHANAGHVALGDFNAASAALGGIPSSVVYAHLGAQDPGYLASVNAIIGWGIPAAQTFEIENLEVGMFGINNQGRFGY
jgi:hypothetical protein